MKKENGMGKTSSKLDRQGVLVFCYKNVLCYGEAFR